MKKITIKLPALKRPTLKELQKGWSWIKSIEHDNSTEKPVVMSLGTVLKDGESSISGTEYEKRLPETAILGYQHAKYIAEHKDEFSGIMDLVKNENFWYIDFPGLVVVYADGNRYYPYLSQSGLSFDQSWHWFGVDFGRGGRFAVSSKVAKSWQLGHSARLPLDTLPLELVVNGITYVRK